MIAPAELNQRLQRELEALRLANDALEAAAAELAAGLAGARPRFFQALRDVDSVLERTLQLCAGRGL